MAIKSEATVSLPEEYSASLSAGELKVSYRGKELARRLPARGLKATIKDNDVTLKITGKPHKALLGTFVAHLKNMISGLKSPFAYKLKICSSHFPMTVKQEGTTLKVRNFIGSTAPRETNVIAGVDISIDKEIITITSNDIELAGKMASNIEHTTRLTGKDRRVFQDGIFIIEKASKADGN